MTTWIVQDNLGSTSSTADAIRQACEETGQNYEAVQVVPFSGALPDMPDVDGSFVLYGRTTMILAAHEHLKWSKGVFYNPDNFTPEAYNEHWGARMLNFDSEIIELGFIPHRAMHGRYFVRPNDDLKFFTGGVMEYEELLEMSRNSMDNLNEPINRKTKIILSSPKEIYREWRLFMVDGKVVSGSQYLPDASSFIPPGVVEYAEKAAKIWTPSPVFVMDIAACKHDFHIIECNCFNGSGFYLSDLNQIVRIVSKYVELNQGD